MVVKWFKNLFATPPCFLCGVEGGDRWTREERVDNKLVKRLLCSSCNKEVFFYPWRVKGTWT